MITEHDLEEAIAECRGQRNPTSSTCIKLAAYYILMEHMYPPQEDVPLSGYSHAPGPETSVVPTADYDSGTEFSEAIQGWDPADLLPIVDELMETVRVLNPRLYSGVMRKIRGL